MLRIEHKLLLNLATPIEEEQLAFQAGGAGLELAGEWTIDSFTSHVAALDLVPSASDPRLCASRPARK